MCDKNKTLGALILTCVLAQLLVGCKPPSIESPDARQRCRAVMAPNFTNQSVLAKIVFEDPADLVRRAALYKVTDQTVLEKVAFNETATHFMREYAIGMITDKDTLDRLYGAVGEQGQNRFLQQAVSERLSVLNQLHWVKADEAALVKFALEAEDISVRLTAMKRLTNHVIIENLATSATVPVNIRVNAINCLTNPFVLARIVVEDPDDYCRRCAWDNLDSRTPKSAGAKLWIALEMKVEEVVGSESKITGFIGVGNTLGTPMWAYPSEREKLRDQILKDLDFYLTSAEKTAADQPSEFRQAAKILRVAQSVSGDRRIMLSVARLLRAFKDPSIYPDIGDVSITVKREKISSELYVTEDGYNTGRVPGEKITYYMECSRSNIVSSARKQPSFRTNWKTTIESYFPKDRPPPFVEADIRFPWLLVEVIREFPQTSLECMALSAGCEDVRWAATLLVLATNQSCMTKVVLNDRDADVRRAAVRKLSDETTLSLLAINDRDRDVRQAAVRKISDEKTLVLVAEKDADGSVRSTAKWRLDKVRLEKRQQKAKAPAIKNPE